ncbi:class I SAM-dependent methyltransferase [Micromonosporaceae bacterium Da 78-11]
MAHHHHDHSPTPGDSMAEVLELDAEVLHEYRAEVLAWLDELSADRPRRRILDLGAGTGTGTLGLVHKFTDAEVTAVDLDPAMLDHLHHQAQRLGVANRIHTVQADLDAGWPAVGGVDLVWAANSMHHMADPDRVLTDVLGALRPGGLLVVAEIDSFPRFLTGRDGAELEARAHAAIAELRAHDMPTMGSDWGARLGKAGFTVEAERVFTIELPAPAPAATGRYARATLGRMRTGLEGRLDADDLAGLDTLVAGLETRDDLSVRAERTIWIARRPVDN